MNKQTPYSQLKHTSVNNKLNNYSTQSCHQSYITFSWLCAPSTNLLLTKDLVYIICTLQDGIVVGPSSVGYKLTTEALVFGGDIMTSTDIAVASGLCDNVGDKERVKHITEDVRSGALEEIKRKIETAVDRVKVFCKVC